jgi:hypothetical protein
MARTDPLGDFELPQEVIENSKLNANYWEYVHVVD